MTHSPAATARSSARATAADREASALDEQPEQVVHTLVEDAEWGEIEEIVVSCDTTH